MFLFEAKTKNKKVHVCKVFVIFVEKGSELLANDPLRTGSSRAGRFSKVRTSRVKAGKLLSSANLVLAQLPWKPVKF